MFQNLSGQLSSRKIDVDEEVKSKISPYNCNPYQRVKLNRTNVKKKKKSACSLSELLYAHRKDKKDVKETALEIST